jgi:hypothetical protein
MGAVITIVLGLLASMSAMVAGALHIGIKAMLRDRDYPVSWWYGHFRDIRLLREAIDNENDPFTKLRYQKVLYGYFASVALFLLSALLFMRY